MEGSIIMQVQFHKFPGGDVIALFPDEIADNNGNIQSYMHIGQHAAASPDLTNELPEATTNEFFPLLRELVQIGYKNLEVINNQSVTYHRQPTKYELKMGYGAIHYADFPLIDCINPKTGNIKKWLKSDGLRYYRS